MRSWASRSTRALTWSKSEVSAASSPIHGSEVREVVFGGATSEIIVRTLGGRVDGVGELVSGQPELELGRAGVLFLFEGPEAIHHVVGMAQGHFPLLADGRGRERLSASPKLPKIADFAESAVRKLAGLELPRARSLVLEARKP